MSAQQVFTPAQVVFGYALLSVLLRGLAFAPIATLIALNVAMSVFYLGNFVFKGILVSVGGARSADRDESIAIAARALSDDELPVFTVLVPMFREPEMLPVLAQALRELDYPLGKLDIKLVLEADDHETIEVARTLGLEGVFEVIRVPPSQPQTKPKACNFALRFARGEYLVIYDAEDRPEPDQLRKVVATFRRSPANTACLQCRLNYFNASENWLTRMFTLDYALWFDQVLPGLERLNIPIPLGGTSNHFKIDVLRELHAWDPFNVTEDADLGIRLTQKGYRVGVVDSTTFEEASCHAGNWIRQRSRWIKGYMQTFLVHTRRPLHLLRTTGPLGFLGFRLLHRRHRAVGPAQSDLLAALSGLAGRGDERLRPGLSAARCCSSACSICSRATARSCFCSMLAPIRRGWLHLIPYSLTVVRLLGADLDRRLQGALAAAAQSVLLGEDAARRVPACRRELGARRGRPRCDAPHCRVRSSALFSVRRRARAVEGRDRAGLVPDDAVTLWAGAITAGDGEMPIGRIVAAYPTIPFLATRCWNASRRRHADAGPAGVASWSRSLAGLWFACVPPRRAAARWQRWLRRFSCVLHPALLRAAIAGPAEMFLAAVSLSARHARCTTCARAAARPK